MMKLRNIVINGFMFVVGIIVGTRLLVPDALINAALSGIMIAIGMWVGTRESTKAMRREIQSYVEESETFKFVKKTLTDQTLIEEATKFFKEARTYISSPEAKNLLINATAALKEFSGAPEVKLKLPEKEVKKLE